MGPEMKAVGQQALLFLAISQMIAFIHFLSLKNHWKGMPAGQKVLHFLRAVIEWPIMAFDYMIFHLRDGQQQLVLPFVVWFITGFVCFKDYYIRFLAVSVVWLVGGFIVVTFSHTSADRHSLT